MVCGFLSGLKTVFIGSVMLLRIQIPAKYDSARFETIFGIFITQKNRDGGDTDKQIFEKFSKILTVFFCSRPVFGHDIGGDRPPPFLFSRQESLVGR